MIETKRVKDRRRLRFESFDEVIRDVEALAAADRGSTLRASGNWTLGQACGHIAYWSRLPFDGYPPLPRPPWFLRLLMSLMKGRLLNKGFPAGVRIPDVAAGTYGVELIETHNALAEMRAAFNRLTSSVPTLPNPLFGPLSHEDWIKLNLRHAELHLSFFHPA